MLQLDQRCLSPDGGSSNLIISESVLTYRQLRDRGWSRQMVAKHLGSADCHTVNPHIGSGRPMRLFSNARVLSIEQMDAFFRHDRDLAKERSSSRAGPIISRYKIYVHACTKHLCKCVLSMIQSYANSR